MKLHIGGELIKDDWKILNANKREGVDYVGDISDLSQFKTESIDEIYASHVLEHVTQNKALDTLKGIHRVLVTDGKLYLSVPDLDILAHTFISPMATEKEKFAVMRMIFGGQQDQYDYHFFGWNMQFLTAFLTIAGFSVISRVDSFGLFDDGSEFKPFGFPISLNVVATK